MQNFPCTDLNDFVSKWHKLFFLSYLRHCDQGSIVVIIYFYKSETKKNTTLLLLELFTATRLSCILKHSAFDSLTKKTFRINFLGYDEKHRGLQRVPLTRVNLTGKAFKSSSVANKDHKPNLIASSVMVIVVGNGHGDTSSNPGRDWLHFT